MYVLNGAGEEANKLEQHIKGHLVDSVTSSRDSFAIAVECFSFEN
jgi:hypothetical protein